MLINSDTEERKDRDLVYIVMSCVVICYTEVLNSDLLHTVRREFSSYTDGWGPHESRVSSVVVIDRLPIDGQLR